MRRTASSIACVTLLVSLTRMHPGTGAATAPFFPDMNSSWYGYQESVAYLLQKGSIQGYPDGTFHPKDTINRAEFLKLLFRSRGATEPASGRCFADVRIDAWYAPYVCAAQRRGIVRGYKVGSRSVFRPEQEVIFAEAIKMLLRAYDKDVPEGTGERWYEPYALELHRSGILPQHAYLPGDLLNRERAADLIARFVQHDEERKILNLSPGCGKARLDSDQQVEVAGLSRSFLLTIPTGYVEHDPSPLIVAFHGRTNSAEQVRQYFGLDREAQNFIIAYPVGSELGVLFFDAIVEELGVHYCIDMENIFVVGHSLGASHANAIACERGGVVRASATVGGSSVMTDCAGPSAALIINNPHDALSPHRSAELMRDLRMRENACTLQTEEAPPHGLACRSSVTCLTDNPVLFCPHTIDEDHRGVYYPHVWPPPTAQAIVQFFEGR